MKQTAIITGANGFIGTYLTNEITKMGNNVIRLIQDNSLNRKDENSNNCRFFDLSDPDKIKGTCKGGNVLFHLAAIPREQANCTEQDYFRINVRGTELLLEEALNSGIQRFIYISSIEAVGPAQNSIPLTEKAQPHPLNNYGKSKLAAELKVLSYNSNRMATVIIRLPMIYGPGNYLNVPKLFRAVQRPIFPFIGNGSAKMEFCFVGNAVHGILLAATHKQSGGECFFISEEPRPLRDVVQAVAAAQNNRPVFVFIPVPLAYLIALLFELMARLFPFKPFRSAITHKPVLTRKTIDWTTHSINICSSAKARMLLQYTPLFSLQEGLEMTIADFRKRGWIK